MRLLLTALLALMLVGCGSQQDPRSGEQAVVAVETTGPTSAPAPGSTPPARAPTPTFVPAAGQALDPVSTQASQSSPPSATVLRTGTSTTIKLEDTAWTGGWRNKGASVYGGRTATWIYGAGTQWSTMQASFDLAQPPRSAGQLTIMAMDSEDQAKTLITISVNGTAIFDGPDPFPNDDLPLATGTWAERIFPVDASLLRAGRNTIMIGNRSPGVFGRPPFFMLDYAVLDLPQ